MDSCLHCLEGLGEPRIVKRVIRSEQNPQLMGVEAFTYERIVAIGPCRTGTGMVDSSSPACATCKGSVLRHGRYGTPIGT